MAPGLVPGEQEEPEEQVPTLMQMVVQVGPMVATVSLQVVAVQVV